MIGLTLSDEWNNNVIYIYAIYHYGRDIFFYGTPDETGGELYAFEQKDLKILDPSIKYEMVYVGNDGNSYFMMLHWALAEDDLLDKLLERDPNSLLLFSKLRWINHKKELT
ncbi:hypothetical protein E0H86_10085 [Acinetobacter sp. ANC 4635]|uniref:hypothetical protein n=1 Tax=Acinetobacter sp. ANC 4635 TaxID=2529846 RepID=UPI00103950B6|nr:hypothetical protein [Acinetobacter sp. ANC 4635]TCB30108.1 hypothetical protein E0H86_10085 [Acinetobacter sp. ANC 4635]